MQKLPSPPCQVCGKPSRAQNLCSSHYSNWLRNGHAESTRPEGWGSQTNHPLKEVWTNTARCLVGRVDRWKKFSDFVKDVGEDRPGEGYRFIRPIKDQPWGPDNYHWREPQGTSRTDLESKSAYSKKWRSANMAKAKGYELKKNYGITVADYDAMLEAQQGKCAICNKECNVYGRLSVDHCHATKKVRALLCTHCNRGIGMFRDDPELLMSAALYMERHK